MKKDKGNISQAEEKLVGWLLAKNVAEVSAAEVAVMARLNFFREDRDGWLGWLRKLGVSEDQALRMETLFDFSISFLPGTVGELPKLHAAFCWGQIELDRVCALWPIPRCEWRGFFECNGIKSAEDLNAKSVAELEYAVKRWFME